MFQWQRASLPIKAIIHMEYMDIGQADPFLVHHPDKMRVLTGWPARQDPAGRLPGDIVAQDFVSHITGDKAVDIVWPL
jgi:hypothetical protein